jgi:hypothetical protein
VSVPSACCGLRFLFQSSLFRGLFFKYFRLNTNGRRRLIIKAHNMTLDDFLQIYDQADLIKTIGALQLEQQNHGKNIRLELLAQHLAKGKANGALVNYDELKKFFEIEFRSHYLEDPTSNFFTENIIFFEGNYTVYPGINNNGVRILNMYLEGIFFSENDVPGKLKKELGDACMLLLCLTDATASKAQLERYSFTEPDDEGIFIPTRNRLEQLKTSVTFSKAEIEALCTDYNLDIEIIDQFVVDWSRINVEKYDPFTNPMLDTPLAFINGEYIFLLPTAGVTTILNFIKRRAKAAKLLNKIDELYFGAQFKSTLQYVTSMGWQLTDIKLPEDNSGLGIREAVCRFDNEKLAYLCFIDPTRRKKRKKNDERSGHELLREREKIVIKYLNDLNAPVEYRYFVLTIVGDNGENSFFIWNKPEDNNQSLAMIFSDFQKMYFDGNLDKLTLWKFAKAYRIAADKMRIFPMTEILDAYVIFNENDGSFLPTDDAPPDSMMIAMGTSSDFDRTVFQRRDEHAVPIVQNGELGHTPVVRHKQFAPIYREREKLKTVRLVIESFSFPVWVVNGQAKDKYQRKLINDYAEAFIFWLFKMSTFIKEYVNQLKLNSLEIEIELDTNLIELESLEIKEIQPESIHIKTSVSDDRILLKIPYDIIHLLFLSDNQGERTIMRALFEPLNQLIKNNQGEIISEDEITHIIDHTIPLGNAKMLLFADSSRNIKLDKRFLIQARHILETETSYILDNLVSYMNLQSKIPESITTAKEKNELCNKIVAGLVKRVTDRLKEFDALEVLKWLLNYNESSIQEREFQKIHIPAKIACFSDFPTELKVFKKKSGEQTSTGLSIRCLIEFVAANPQWGSRLMNIDELDELLALMNEVVVWGMIADSINLKMDDPEMGILPSGRIGVDYSFFSKSLEPFSNAKIETSLYNMVENFPDNLNIKIHEASVESTLEKEETNDAFTDEFGISLSEIMRLKGTLAKITMNSEDSVLLIEETSLEKTLYDKLSDMTKGTISIGLELLSLKSRPNIGKAPDGFEQNDIYPWKYNRALSFRRRPLVKVLNPKDGKIYYSFGFRHLIESAEYLESLLRTGRLKSKDGGKLNALLSKVNKEKGDNFRDYAKEWIKANTSLEVTDYEVEIDVDGHLICDKNLGDIDILAVDKTTKTIYSIECKNTVGARAIHEMKSEMDNYLGRDGSPGMIEKHVIRDKWLKENVEQLRRFVKLNDEDKINIKSLVLTSKDIPTIYLASGRLPLPMISFPKLKREGFSVASN